MMKKNSDVLLGFVLLMQCFFVGASDMNIKFGICELGSNCEECVESFEFSFISEFVNRRVVAIGYDKGGKAIWREHKGCQMKNITNWRCTGFHGDYVSRNGQVTLEKNSKTYYNFKNLEICNFPLDDIEEAID
jgi:hypothetical protein